MNTLKSIKLYIYTILILTHENYIQLVLRSQPKLTSRGKKSQDTFKIKNKNHNHKPASDDFEQQERSV